MKILKSMNKAKYSTNADITCRAFEDTLLKDF